MVGVVKIGSGTAVHFVSAINFDRAIFTIFLWDAKGKWKLEIRIH